MHKQEISFFLGEEQKLCFCLLNPSSHNSEFERGHSGENGGVITGENGGLGGWKKSGATAVICCTVVLNHVILLHL